MDKIILDVANNIKKYRMISPGDKIIVGLSGGPDSVFLVTVLQKLKDILKFDIGAAHVNHKIRGSEADADELFSLKLCEDYGIAFHCAKIDVPKQANILKTSEENAGRIARYKFFNDICSKFGYNKIAVAHNMNDSVETVLINLIRGCSLNGLGGIRPINNNVIRPIINISKERILEYLKNNAIEYKIDKTNNDNVYTRNKIRNVILESMKEINPSVIETIYSNLDNLRNDDDYISSECIKSKCITQNGKDVVIDRIKLSELPPSLKKRVIIRGFAAICGKTNNVEKKHINILLGDLQSGNYYNMPNGIVAEVSFDKIILSPLKNTVQISRNINIPVLPPCVVDFDNDLKVKFDFVCNADFSIKDCLYIDYDQLETDNIILRKKLPGDKMIPYGMSGEKKLKKLYTELKIPVSKRESIPVLCSGSTIAAVIPYRISDKYKVNDNTKAILRIQMIKEN